MIKIKLTEMDAQIVVKLKQDMNVKEVTLKIKIHVKKSVVMEKLQVLNNVMTEILKIMMVVQQIVKQKKKVGYVHQMSLQFVINMVMEF